MYLALMWMWVAFGGGLTRPCYPSIGSVDVFAVLATALHEAFVTLTVASIGIDHAVLLRIGEPRFLSTAFVMIRASRSSFGQVHGCLGVVGFKESDDA